MESVLDTLAIMLDTVKLAVASAFALVSAPVDTSAVRSSTLAAVLAAEVSLRVCTWLVSSAADRRLLPVGHMRILAYAVLVTSPLLPTCCSSWEGFFATLFFCSLPCCAVPIGLSLIFAAQLPQFGLRPDVLLPYARRAVALAVPSVATALLLGPSDMDAAASTGVHAAALLLVMRLVWATVRSAAIMPSLLISRAGPMTQRDRRLAQLAAGESCFMQRGATRYKVSRLALGRGGRVDAFAVEHPERPDKWVLTLHGNGEHLLGGSDRKLHLAAQLGCSVIACDYREVGRSAGLLLTADDAMECAAECVRWCETRLRGNDAASSILILGQSMGGGVAAELAARRFPALPCVNERSFASLSLVSAWTVGLGGSALTRAAVRLVLTLAFSRAPWRAPLATAANWRRLPPGRKMLVYHPADRVIGHASALHTVLALAGQLDGTHVVRLSGEPDDAHNEDPADFSPQEWAEAVAWMRNALELH